MGSSTRSGGGGSCKVSGSGIGTDLVVQRVRLYRGASPIWLGGAAPFCCLYALVAAWWCAGTLDTIEEAAAVAAAANANTTSRHEPAALLLAAVGLAHLLTALSCYWSCHVHCFLTCYSENDPIKARIAKVVPTEHNGFTEIVKLHHAQSTDTEENPKIWFIFQKLKYVYDWDKNIFKLIEFPVHKWASEYLLSKGLQSDEEVSQTETDYGKNQLDMDVPEFMELFKERATAPFFVFQVFCVALWCMDKYWYYSLFTLVMLIIFECTLVQQQLRNMAEIRKMGNKPYPLSVYRNQRWRDVSSNQLVPGDIVSLIRPLSDLLVPCDIVLLRGSCIVDESMLTGESVPQMKEPLELEYEKNKDWEFDADGDGKLHLLFGGTKIVQHSGPSKTGSGLRSPDNGCIGYVIRTGFNTSQGKLLRTILFGVKRVTANNLETFGFILFLLIFAIAAAAYVWVKGCEDPERNRYKLFLECTLILTSVVPPELPIELSLAVNTSLLSLSKLSVFCTEPFRIPFAGKIEICCFDKTGTLTSDNLVVEGVAGIATTEYSNVIPLTDAPIETIQVLATCHSLVQLDDGIVGDPLEKATLTAVEWNLTKRDAVIPKKGKHPGLKIFQRYHFSSALKRMSVLAGYQTTDMGSLETYYIGTVKGAPETLKSMFNKIPEHYDEIYLSLSRRGARVLALGQRNFGKLSSQEVYDLKREDIESELNFAGFVIISCPLKSDSKKAIAEILNSSHLVTMITGDNPLTACHVAKELNFTQNTETLIFTKVEKQWMWKSINEEFELPIKPKIDTDKFLSLYDLCITGDGLTYLTENHPDFLSVLLPHIRVFARFDPKQKEYVILKLKELGYCTLMCGDGTNDVGALKHAEVGVAILSNAPERLPEKKSTKISRDSMRRIGEIGEQITANPERNVNRRMNVGNHSNRNSSNNRDGGRNRREGPNPNVDPNAEVVQAQIQKYLKEMEEMNKSQIVKLGDASIAAPFTSRLSSIMCICHIIKQGRCTLVTTLQMFKILALNALILAYSQSVLYLDGIKFSDVQATLQGLLLASCFLFISRSKPLDKLSKQRPLPNIFNMYTIMTVLLQSAVHFCCLIYLVIEATNRSPARVGKVRLALDLPDDAEEEPFVPDLLNSTVYIISMALQVSTFAINYRGEPFMESLSANRPLMYSVLISGGTVFALALGILPDLSNQFEVVPFPSEFKVILVQVLIADMVFAYLADRACLWLFGEGRLRH